VSWVPRTISFPGGAISRVIETAQGVDGDTLLRRLEVPPPRGSLIVNGTTAPLGSGLDGLGELLARGVADVAVSDGLTVVTGATDAGIFSLLGAAMAGATAPLIGVAPLGLVSWPDRPPAGPDLEPLESHHSHFVLVEGQEWGDETGTLLALAQALGTRAPSAAVLCGGGEVARNETLGHVRAGRPVVVLAGSGRLADELAAAVAGTLPPGDPSLTEMAGGDLLVCPLSAGAEALAAALRGLMAGRR